MRGAASGLAAVLAAGLLSAELRAGYIDDDGTVVLKVWNRISEDATNVDAMAGRAVAEAFARHYQKKYGRPIRLTGSQGMSIEGMGMESAPLLAIAGGVSPDVIYVNFRQSDTYIQNEFLEPLDPLIERLLTPEQQLELKPLEFEKEYPKLPPEKQAALLLRVPKPVLPVIRRRGPTRDGPQVRYWALPYGKYIMSLWFRKDVFAAAGVEPGKWVYRDRPRGADTTFKAIFAEAGMKVDAWRDEQGRPFDWDSPRPCPTWADIAPRNWKELFELCCAITDHEKGIYALFLYSGEQASWNFFNFLWSAGSDAVRQDPETGQWYSVFNDEGAVEATLFYRLLLKYPYRDYTGKQREGVAYRDMGSQVEMWWQQRKIGMMFRYLRDELVAEVNPDECGIAPVPLGPYGQRGSELNCTMMGVFSRIADERVREAAFEYVWFWGSTEAVRIRTQIYVAQGYAKFINPVLLEKFGFSEYLREVPKGLREVHEEALENGKPEPYGHNCQFVYRQVTIPMDEVLYYPVSAWEGMSPEQRRAATQAILNTGVAATDEKMIGRLPEGERQKRLAWATVVAGAVVVIFAGVFWYISRALTLATGKMARGGVAGRNRRWAYVLMAPALATILLWQYIPLARGTGIAFMDYRIVGVSRWVGLQNFADVIFDPVFWTSVGLSLYYVILMITLTFVPPIALAILLQEVPRGKVLYRTLYYLPAVTTGLVIMFLWRGFFEPSEHGMLNMVLMSVNQMPPATAAASKVLLLGLLAVVAWLLFRIPQKMTEEPITLGSVLWALPTFLAALGGAYWLLGFVVPGSSAVAVPSKLLMASLLVAGLWQTIKRLARLPDDLVSVRIFWMLPVAVLAIGIGWQVFTGYDQILAAGDPRPFWRRVVGLAPEPGWWWLEAWGRWFADLAQWVTSVWQVKPATWLKDPDLAMFCCVIPQMWAGMGPGCLIYLAALKSVPDDLYEAADLDGATFFGKVRHIVFPILKPLIIIQFVAAFIAAFRAVQFIFVVSGPGPKMSTNVVGLEIFYNSFLFLRFGIATSMAWILGAGLIGFTVFQLRILSRVQFTTAGSRETNR